MAWAAQYHPDVAARDLPGIPGNVRGRLRRAIETRLLTAPERYGLRLRGDLAGTWKLRVGDYRIVFDVDARRELVSVLCIAHRRIVYAMAPKRRVGRTPRRRTRR